MRLIAIKHFNPCPSSHVNLQIVETRLDCIVQSNLAGFTRCCYEMAIVKRFNQFSITCGDKVCF